GADEQNLDVGRLIQHPAEIFRRQRFLHIHVPAMNAGRQAKGIEVRAAHFPGRDPIDAYGNGGFRFADMSHRGSILCL
ncbi:hypothetical protein ACC697_39810, partial [Rhizobium ruizarguesonis]